MKKDEVMIYITAILANILNLACFTALAIIFQKWWIIFFAIFFTTSVSTNNKKDDKEV